MSLTGSVGKTGDPEDNICYELNCICPGSDAEARTSTPVLVLKPERLPWFPNVSPGSGAEARKSPGSGGEALIPGDCIWRSPFSTCGG